MRSAVRLILALRDGRLSERDERILDQILGVAVLSQQRLMRPRCPCGCMWSSRHVATLCTIPAIIRRRAVTGMIGRTRPRFKVLDKILQMALARRLVLLIRSSFSLDTGFRRHGIHAGQIGLEAIAAAFLLAAAF